MSRPPPTHLASIGLGILVTFLWATSWVLIKLGLSEEGIGPIGFSAVRYGIAAIILLALAMPQLVRVRVWRAGRSTLSTVAIYGLVLFGLAQAAQFVAIGELPAATVSLFIATAPALIVLLALGSRHEAPSRGQLAGVGILTIGVAVFFGLELPPEGALLGVAAAIVVTFSVAGSARVGRSLAVASPHTFGGVLGLTAIAMACGATGTLVVAVVVEGVPQLSTPAWLYVGWMAVINTAFAFTVWTHTMRTLTAVESSALADLMVVQVAALAWLVLGETLDLRGIVGLGLTLLGVLIVQLAPLRDRRRAREPRHDVDEGGVPDITDMR